MVNFRFMKKKDRSVLGNHHKAINIAKNLRGDEQALHKTRKHMFSKYDENAVDTLRKKAGENTEKYNRNFGKLVQEFYADTKILFERYTKVFTELNNIVEAVDKEEYQDLKSSFGLLREAEQYPKPMVFTDEQIDEFNKGLRHVYDKVKKESIEVLKNSRRMAHQHEPKHLGRLKMHKSNGGLAKDVTKAEKILAGDEQGFQDIKQRIHNELKQGVKIDLPVLFQEYVKDFTEVEFVLLRVRVDIYILLNHHVHEHNKEVKNWMKFKELIPEGHKIPSLEEEFKEFYGDEKHNSLTKKVNNFLQREYRSMKYILHVEDSDEHEEQNLIDRLRHDKEKAIQHIEHMTA